MPMQLPLGTGLDLHRHASERLGNRELCDRRLFSKTLSHDLALGFLRFEFEGREFLPGGILIGRIVEETDGVESVIHGLMFPLTLSAVVPASQLMTKLLLISKQTDLVRRGDR